MPKIEIEIPDDGSVDFSKLPEPLRVPFQSEFDRAMAKGATRKMQELESKGALATPEERTELQKLRDEAKQRALKDDEQAKNYEAAKAKLLEDSQREIATREQEIQRRDARLRDSLKTDIRAAAIAAGAREESITELEALLSPRLDFDADLRAFVKGEDGKPATAKDGKALTIAQLVTEYVETHPHHKAAPTGRSGGAPGGRSMRGASAVGHAERDAAVARVAEAPTVENVGALLANAGKR